MNESDSRPSFVVLSVEELRKLLREAVRAELEAQPEEHEPSPMITPAEAGRLLRLSSRQVINLCTSGKLPAVRVGSRWRIRREDIPGASDAA